MVTEADHEHWSESDLRPYAEQVLTCFGPERIMFGSDWPVVTLASGYRRWFDTVLALVEGLSAAEQGRIFHHNAIEFYRLGG